LAAHRPDPGARAMLLGILGCPAFMLVGVLLVALAIPLGG
jgi:hypothetical protein